MRTVEIGRHEAEEIIDLIEEHRNEDVRLMELSERLRREFGMGFQDQTGGQY